MSRFVQITKPTSQYFWITDSDRTVAAGRKGTRTDYAVLLGIQCVLRGWQRRSPFLENLGDICRGNVTDIVT